MIKKIIQCLSVFVLLLASLMMAGNVKAWSGCGPSYVVEPGDTLFRIAGYCGVTRDEIRMANPGLVSWVYVGQVLVIPIQGTPGGYQYSDYQHENYQHRDGSMHVVTYGDTLRNISMRYGVSMDDLARANGIFDYDNIFIGQRLRIPVAGSMNYDHPLPPPPQSTQPIYGGSTYAIQAGDTLKNLAYRWGVGIYDILAVNPQIVNASLIYAGQVINIPYFLSAPVAPPSVPGYYTVQEGDTLRIIADMYGTSVYNLQLLNPQIWNPNWIYAGMVVRVQ